MNKILLICSLLLVTISSQAKSLSIDTLPAPKIPYDTLIKDYGYSSTKEIPGLTKRILCQNFKAWVIKNFKNPSFVVEMNDVEDGRIIVKGTEKNTCEYQFLETDHSFNYYLKFVIDFTAKDGKYRVKINEFSYDVSASDYNRKYEKISINQKIDEVNDYNLQERKIKKVKGLNKNSARVDSQMLEHTHDFGIRVITGVNKEMLIAKRDNF